MKVLGVIGNLFAVLILSIIIFFAIYFIWPNISMKCFGTAFNEDKYINKISVEIKDKIEEIPQITGEVKESSFTLIDSDEGLALIKYATTSNGKNIEQLIDIFTSDEGRMILDNAVVFVNNNFGNYENYYKSDEAKKLWKEATKSK